MRKLTDSEFRRRARKVHGDQFTVLSAYKGRKPKVKVRHNPCDWVGEVQANNLLEQNYGAQCPTHDERQFNSSSFQKAINRTQDGQYTLLSKFVNTRTRVNIKCNICGRKFHVLPNSLLNRRFGKNCNHKVQLNFEQAAKRLNRISAGEIKLICFSGMDSVATFKHLECGNTWQTEANDVFHKISGCPTCSTVSKGEKAVTRYLKKNEILFKPQFTFSNCKDKRMLPFDFAVFNKGNFLNCVVEYQGCQHYTSIFRHKSNILFSTKSVSRTQKHDKMKSFFCQEHGIQLICIDHPQTASKFDKPSFIADLVKRVLDKELKVN